MPTSQVHIFVSLGQFHSWEQVTAYLDPTYTEDGDCLPSTFMRETHLDEFEPTCIEVQHFTTPRQGRDLFPGFSWSDRWAQQVECLSEADTVICVFPPNQLVTPEQTVLTYLGCVFFEEPS